ncbi:DUF3889 domain-containing protein [Paenibacillus sp. D2_2]|uniref:DUF3889 domain-containing protein n=1 Tax=Paenibacillus sp. D2_2 TaxID=3073092 RepID=UPI0028165F7C|nr:DUF3889 domain-containing protein [Paenibacillus sp. D2_2]WMT43606.1 DUF3889 domain-containing protein [Paenibacillus sp. D2_2]
MVRLTGTMLASIALLFSLLTPVSAAVPEYAKWGTIAVKETQRHYQADIIDYLHVGRSYLASDKVEEKFKLWIRTKDGNEFGVNVYIQFNPANDTTYAIRYEKIG